MSTYACTHLLNPPSYEVTGVLGKGSFGQVLQVLDYATGEVCALKVIRNKKRFHHQAQVSRGGTGPLCCRSCRGRGAHALRFKPGTRTHRLGFCR